jgi:hypothetical protein
MSNQTTTLCDELHCIIKAYKLLDEIWVGV